MNAKRKENKEKSKSRMQSSQRHVQPSTDSFGIVMFLVKPLLTSGRDMAGRSWCASCPALAECGQSRTTHAVAAAADVADVAAAVTRKV